MMRVQLEFSQARLVLEVKLDLTQKLASLKMSNSSSSLNSNPKLELNTQLE